MRHTCGLRSYKEPGELKISQLEARRDTAKQDADVSSDEDEVFEQPSTKKGTAQPKKRRVSGAGASVAPRSSAAKPARHSMDGSESLLGTFNHFCFLLWDFRRNPLEARLFRNDKSYSSNEQNLLGCCKRDISAFFLPWVLLFQVDSAK